MNKADKIQMTTGSLWKNILLFSIPLMLSQLLEVMFNISDVAIVGKFADYRALGSVGSTTLLVSLFIGFLIGMGSGVNVRVAHMLGSDDSKAVGETIHTSFIICLSVGLIICAVCVFGAEWMLSILHTKPELIDGAIMYLRIYAIGLPGMAIYNWGNGILSARGETTRPLIYLAISGTLNVILNLFFVIKCHRAADGVAMASAISQYVSAALILIHLLHRNDACRFTPSHIRFHKNAAVRVLALGLPAGLQNAIFAIANLFVQTGVNSFDEIMVSGNSAASNADTIIFNVLAAFYTACATFAGQNLGARNRKRVLKSYLVSLTYYFNIVRTGIFVTIYIQRGCYRCRNGAYRNNVVFLCSRAFNGLHNQRIKGHRQKSCSHNYSNNGILCIPCHMGLHNFCIFPYDTFFVFIIYFFMVYNGGG